MGTGAGAAQPPRLRAKVGFTEDAGQYGLLEKVWPYSMDHISKRVEGASYSKRFQCYFLYMALEGELFIKEDF